MKHALLSSTVQGGGRRRPDVITGQPIFANPVDEQSKIDGYAE